MSTPVKPGMGGGGRPPGRPGTFNPPTLGDPPPLSSPHSTVEKPSKPSETSKQRVYFTITTTLLIVLAAMIGFFTLIVTLEYYMRIYDRFAYYMLLFHVFTVPHDTPVNMMPIMARIGWVVKFFSWLKYKFDTLVHPERAYFVPPHSVYELGFTNVFAFSFYFGIIVILYFHGVGRFVRGHPDLFTSETITKNQRSNIIRITKLCILYTLIGELVWGFSSAMFSLRDLIVNPYHSVPMNIINTILCVVVGSLCACGIIACIRHTVPFLFCYVSVSVLIVILVFIVFTRLASVATTPVGQILIIMVGASIILLLCYTAKHCYARVKKNFDSQSWWTLKKLHVFLKENKTIPIEPTPDNKPTPVETPLEPSIPTPTINTVTSAGGTATARLTLIREATASNDCYIDENTIVYTPEGDLQSVNIRPKEGYTAGFSEKSTKLFKMIREQLPVNYEAVCDYKNIHPHMIIRTFTHFNTVPDNDPLLLRTPNPDVNARKLLIGINDHCQDVIANLEENPGLLIAGASGWGKTETIKALMEAVPDTTEFYIAIGKGDPGFSRSSLPIKNEQIRFFNGSVENPIDPIIVNNMLNMINDIALERGKQLSVFCDENQWFLDKYNNGRRYKSVWEVPQDNPEAPRFPLIIVFFDEIQSYTFGAQKIPKGIDGQQQARMVAVNSAKMLNYNLLEELMRIQRSSKIMTWISSQRILANEISVSTRTQMGLKICLYQPKAGDYSTSLSVTIDDNDPSVVLPNNFTRLGMSIVHYKDLSNKLRVENVLPCYYHPVNSKHGTPLM